MFYSTSWKDPFDYLDISSEKAKLFKIFPERSILSLINPQLLPFLKHVYLTGNFWTLERCRMASSLIDMYGPSSNPFPLFQEQTVGQEMSFSRELNTAMISNTSSYGLNVTFFHIGGASLPIYRYSPVDLLHFHNGIFRIQPLEIDYLARIVPYMTNMQILEITTTPDFSFNPPRIAKPNKQLLRSIRRLSQLKRLVLNDSYPNSIAIPATDASWIPPSMTSLECHAGHITGTLPTIDRNIYNQIRHLSFGFGVQSQRLTAFPFSNLVSLTINEDWSRTGYKSDIIREAVKLNRHTLETLVCLSLEVEEILYIAKRCYRLKKFKIFKFHEGYNSKKFLLKGLLSVFTKYNPKQLQEITLPVHNNSISYESLERFVVYFEKLRSFVLYTYYPLMSSYTDTRVIKTNLIDKIQQLLEPLSFSPYILHNETQPLGANKMTPNQELLGHYLFTISCFYCSGTYLEAHKFDVQASHFFLKLVTIREHAFIRDSEGISVASYVNWKKQTEMVQRNQDFQDHDIIRTYGSRHRRLIRTTGDAETLNVDVIQMQQNANQLHDGFLFQRQQKPHK